VSDQRPNRHSAFNRGLNRLLDFFEVEAENDEVERFLGILNGVERRLAGVSRLNDQFHRIPPAGILLRRRVGWPAKLNRASGHSF
jgi:hypothetical protein